MKAQDGRQALGECVPGFLPHAGDGTFLFGQTNSGAGANLSFAAKPLCCQRRHNWPQVAANCPEFDVKQRILSHEYEELVEDEHSKSGHMDLIFRQAKKVWVELDDVMNAEPLPTTRAACTRGSGSRARVMAGGDRGIDHRRVDERRSALGDMGGGIAAGSIRFGRGHLISAPRRCQTSRPIARPT